MPSAKLPYLVMIAIAGLIVVLTGWYARFYYKEQNALFFQETQLVQKYIRVEADAVIVRLKDAAAFIASDAEDKISAKLEVASRKPVYMSDLGYVRSTAPDRPVSLLGQPSMMRGVRSAVLELEERLFTSEGLVFAFSPIEHPGLFPDLGEDSIVMAQALQKDAANSGSILVYAVIDLKALVRDVSASLTHGHIVSVSFSSFPQDVTYEFPPPKSIQPFPPKTVTSPATIAANLTLFTKVRQSTSDFLSLIVMMGGLFLIGLVAATLGFLFIRDQRASQRQLKAAFADATQASEAKTTFLANMSHEIRTPLNGVLGMAELLSRTELSADQQRYADQIKASGSVLLAILNDILDIAKIESGEIAIDPVRTRLPSLLVDIATFYAPSVQQKDIALLIDLDPALPEVVEVDPTRLRQIVSNLLSNALKFTHQGEVILAGRLQTYDPQSREAIVEFSVADTGIGIADASIGRLFSRFSQAEDNTTRLYGGSGLGLSICKEICELMGGSIGVRSEEGKGSTFSFALPLPVVEAAPAQSPLSVRAALVSSSSSLADILKRGLEARGVSCDWFIPTVDVAERIARAQAGGDWFDILLLDQGTHIRQALEVQARAHAISTLAGVPCIVLGNQEANPRYPDFDQAVIKPFDSRVLVKTIHRFVGATGADETEAVAGPVRPHHPRFERRKALLVDDNNVNLLFGDEVLRTLGFEVEQANDGRKAVDLARTGRFDVIFMDCQMPVMDGYEAASILRREMKGGRIRTVPIVAVTANALKGDREKCLAAGMDAFVTKPMSVADLEAVLQSLEGLAPAPEAAATTKEKEVEMNQPTRGDAPADQRPFYGNVPKPRPAANTQTAPAAASRPAPQAASAPAPASAPTPAEPSAASRPAPAERSKVPLIDIAAFKRARASITKFETLVSFYSNDTAEYLETIRAALASGRIEDAVMPAHTIKSSSQIVGASALAYLAEAFEKRARTGGEAKVKELNTLRLHMERVFPATIEAIRKMMEEGAKTHKAA
ncbi:hybrid sensor histidine kinase/response regulator [Afifella sp. IM 167]|uniref:hybrid sensor histidine kinase/response regulator n=1 Tax=Afifella sp. IM 167 TaxID=2033586 RepID=UPI001CCB9915|nr:hybrid sensor histidine kinase/response regulator [Afifella sp. IM 167]